VIEVIKGLFIHSLSLLSDAGHNLSNVGALAFTVIIININTAVRTLILFIAVGFGRLIGPNKYTINMDMKKGLLY
jgi:Co/Zn/Cd efflux system component